MTLLVSLLLTVGSFSKPSTPHEGHILQDSTETTIFATANALEDSVRSLYDRIGLAEYGLSFKAFRYGMIGYFNLQQTDKLGSRPILSIIDFSQSSNEKRFYTIDLQQHVVLFNTYVSHGKNSGSNTVTSFSNAVHSNQSSLGFYVTAETYVGSKGYSLKLDGQDPGFNDNMRTRAVVMHEADYVSERWIRTYGRLGRSQGCPALPKELSKKIIDSIKNGTLIFAYFDDEKFLKTSSHVSLENIIQQTSITAATGLQ